jgi:hypothetical protein
LICEHAQVAGALKSVEGQQRSSRPRNATSILPLTTDMTRLRRHVDSRRLDDRHALRLPLGRSLMEQTEERLISELVNMIVHYCNSLATAIEKMRAVRSSATLIFPSPLNLPFQVGDL